MSWDVSLEVAEVPVAVAAHEDGGTYAMGGLPSAELNIFLWSFERRKEWAR